MKKKTAVSSQKREPAYELLRLTAIVLVIFNHTDQHGYYLYTLPGVSTINFTISLLLGIFCKIAVPLFLMISGGFLLGKKEPISVVLRKRVLRIALVLLIFTGVTYGFWVHWGRIDAPGIGDFLRTLFFRGVSVPYWYLYLYLALMLMLPLLRPLAQNMRDKDYLYLTVLHLLFCGAGTSAAVLCGEDSFHDDFWLFLALPNIYYFLMGYYFVDRLDLRHVTGRRLTLLWLLAAASIGWMFFLSVYDLRTAGEVTFEVLNCLGCFQVFAVYLTVRYLDLHHPMPGWLAKFCGWAGPCTFGAYLLEGILRQILLPVYTTLEPKIHVLPACAVWVLCVAAAGIAISWALRQIPGLRKLL